MKTMLWKAILIFTLVPLLELALLIRVGQYLGVIPTIFIVAVTGFIGVLLAKMQGLSVIQKVRVNLKGARLPAMNMIEGLLIIIGASMLLTPGLITDTAGFLLIIPYSRLRLAQLTRNYFNYLIRERVISFHSNHYHDYEMDSSDVEFNWEEDERE